MVKTSEVQSEILNVKEFPLFFGWKSWSTSRAKSCDERSAQQCSFFHFLTRSSIKSQHRVWEGEKCYDPNFKIINREQENIYVDYFFSALAIFLYFIFFFWSFLAEWGAFWCKNECYRNIRHTSACHNFFVLRSTAPSASQTLYLHRSTPRTK